MGRGSPWVRRGLYLAALAGLWILRGHLARQALTGPWSWPFHLAFVFLLTRLVWGDLMGGRRLGLYALGLALLALGWEAYQCLEECPGPDPQAYALDTAMDLASNALGAWLAVRTLRARPP